MAFSFSTKNIANNTPYRTEKLLTIYKLFTPNNMQYQWAKHLGILLAKVRYNRRQVPDLALKGPSAKQPRNFRGLTRMRLLTRSSIVRSISTASPIYSHLEREFSGKASQKTCSFPVTQGFGVDLRESE